MMNTKYNNLPQIVRDRLAVGHSYKRIRDEVGDKNHADFYHLTYFQWMYVMELCNMRDTPSPTVSPSPLVQQMTESHRLKLHHQLLCDKEKDLKVILENCQQAIGIALEGISRHISDDNGSQDKNDILTEIEPISI